MEAWHESHSASWEARGTQEEAGSINTFEIEFDTFLEGLFAKAAVILERKLKV